MANHAQKFHKGDLVRVAKDLGPFMKRFTADCRAIVIGSYKDQYGGSDPQNSQEYTLYLEGQGETSWYYENQLSLIARDRSALLDEWLTEREAQRARESDLDWIFANADKFANGYGGTSIATLGKHLGIENLWGSHGEGMSLYENSIAILSVAAPFLEKGDKDGFLAFAQTHKLPTVDYVIR